MPDGTLGWQATFYHARTPRIVDWRAALDFHF